MIIAAKTILLILAVASFTADGFSILQRFHQALGDSAQAQAHVVDCRGDSTVGITADIEFLTHARDTIIELIGTERRHHNKMPRTHIQSESNVYMLIYHAYFR